jgi:hypothetical protein
MGRRSRKRMADGVPAAGGSSRAERDAARRERAEAAAGARGRTSRTRGRPSIDERPPPPWGSFPLSEIAVFVSIVMIVGSFFVQGSNSTTAGYMFIAGLLLGTLAGLEVAVREHFSGFRSHSSLLGGFLAIATITVVAYTAGRVFVPILLAIGLAVFGAAFWSLREAFRRRSGGVSFR